MLVMPYEQASGRYAAGYIRESSEDFGRDLDAQKEGQREDVRAVAKRDGADPERLRWYDDWGRSGSEHAKRPSQDRLLADVRKGHVAVIYARSLDRLMRSTQRLRDLWKDCEATGTRIVTMREGDVSADRIESNPSAWMFVQSIMTAAEYESRVGRVRAKAAVATKRRDGTRLGQAPYGEDKRRPDEDPKAVLTAYEAEGSFLAAAQALNRAKVPTRLRSDTGWDATSVARVVKRDEHVRGRHPGIFDTCPKCWRPERARVAKRSIRRYAGLLQCHCGSTLTSMERKTTPTRRQRTSTIAYYCKPAQLHSSPVAHEHYVVAESKISDVVAEWLKDIRTVVAHKAEPDMAQVEQRRESLRAERTKVLEQNRKGWISDAEAEQAINLIRADLEEVEQTTAAWVLGSADKPGVFADQPLVDLAGDAVEVNEDLRKLWVRIRLGRDMLPLPLRPDDWVPGAYEWFVVGDASEDVGRDDERAGGRAEDHPYNRHMATRR